MKLNLAIAFPYSKICSDEVFLVWIFSVGLSNYKTKAKGICKNLKKVDSFDLVSARPVLTPWLA